MIYFYCIFCNGKAYNGSIQLELMSSVDGLIDEIYNNDSLKEMNVTKDNSVIVSLSKL